MMGGGESMRRSPRYVPTARERRRPGKGNTCIPVKQKKKGHRIDCALASFHGCRTACPASVVSVHGRADGADLGGDVRRSYQLGDKGAARCAAF